MRFAPRERLCRLPCQGRASVGRNGEGVGTSNLEGQLGFTQGDTSNRRVTTQRRSFPPGPALATDVEALLEQRDVLPGGVTVARGLLSRVTHDRVGKCSGLFDPRGRGVNRGPGGREIRARPQGTRPGFIERQDLCVQARATRPERDQEKRDPTPGEIPHTGSKPMTPETPG